MNKTLNERIKDEDIQITVRRVRPFMNRAWKRRRAKELLREKKRENR